jgi:hypothetical protein
VHLAFGLELASLGEKPVAIVSRDLGRFDIEPTQFPITTGLLKYLREHGSSFCRIRVDEDDRIFPRWQILEVEGGAIGRLSILAENTAVKFGALDDLTLGCAPARSG